MAFDEGNGIPDAAEMMVLEAVLGNVGYNRVPNGGTGYRSVYAAWAANRTQAAADLPGEAAAVQRAIAAYMTLGESGHIAFAVSTALEVASVTLDPADYTDAPGLGALDDADGDSKWNRLEWRAVLEEYQVTTPTSAEAAVYVNWVLNPELPADEDVDIGMDLPDGADPNWDYSYLPQGTVTFQSVDDVPIEVRILDPPGREDIPVVIGQPVDIPLGAELLVTLAEGANPDWFYKWSATGNMIDGSGESTERFRLMRGGTIRPVRRPIASVGLPVSPQGENAFSIEWSGVGPFGHLIEPTPDSGGNSLDVPEGGFLLLRAYKSKQPAGGAGTSTAGDDRTYCKKWVLWDDYYNGDYYVYGSMPKFGNFTAIGYTIYPSFDSVPAPHGWFTLTASCNEGGYSLIAGNGPVNSYIAPVLYETATVPAPASTDTTHYNIVVDLITIPGFENAGPTEEFTGYYTGGFGDLAVTLVALKMLKLETEVQVEGGSGASPAEAGLITVEEAKRWYSVLGVEYVRLDASAHLPYKFERWSGEGIAYGDGDDEPDFTWFLWLNNEELPVVYSSIWVAVDDEGGVSRSVTAHFRPLKALVVKAGADVADYSSAFPALTGIGYDVTNLNTSGLTEQAVFDAICENEAVFAFQGHGVIYTGHHIDTNPQWEITSDEVSQLDHGRSYRLVYVSSCCSFGCEDGTHNFVSGYVAGFNAQCYVGWVGLKSQSQSDSWDASFWNYMSQGYDAIYSVQQAREDNNIVYGDVPYPNVSGNTRIASRR